MTLKENGLNITPKKHSEKQESGLRNIKKKEVAAITTAVVIAGIKIIGTKMYRKLNPTNTQIERDRIDHTYYDPSSGLHWDLKRRLTNLERSRVDEARRNGTPVYDILKAMKVLKK